MVRNQSNDNLKCPMIEKVAIWMGLVYSFGVVAFFSFISPKEDGFSGAKSMMTRYMYLTFFFNCLSFALWTWGTLAKKPGLMVLSVFFWGIPMNLWTGLTFLLTTIKILFGRKGEYFYENDSDIWINLVTLFFVLVYFALILVYLIIKHSIESRTLVSAQLEEEKFIMVYWKCAGMAVAWLMVSFITVIVLYTLCLSLSFTELVTSLALLAMFLNIVCTVFWLSGVSKDLIGRMLLALLYWGLVLSVWIYTMCYVYIDRTDGRFGTNTFGFIALKIFCVTVYAIAVLTFIKIKRAVGNPWDYADLHISFTSETNNHTTELLI